MLPLSKTKLMFTESASASCLPAATSISTRCRGTRSDSRVGCDYRCCARATRASTEERSLERDFAHGFGAEDFANVEAFHGGGAALVFGAHDFLDDRVHFVAQSVERRHVRILHHDEDVAVLRAHRIAFENFVIEDDLLLFSLVVNWLHGLADGFEIIISQSRFGFYHGQDPDRAFGVRRIAAAPSCARAHARRRRAGLREAKAGDAKR